MSAAASRARAPRRDLTRFGGRARARYTERVIVFCDTKVQAHRMMLLCALSGLSAAELHGNLNQPQRLDALDRFRQQKVDVLLCTDIAARGLDIAGVQTVINWEMPSALATYIHRVGRTARAGRTGRAVTLVGEARRPVMKELVRSSPEGSIKSRAIAPSVVAHFEQKAAEREPQIEQLLSEEAAERRNRQAEMEVERAQNLIVHQDEIASRPARQWFQQKDARKEQRAAKSSAHPPSARDGAQQATRGAKRKTPPKSTDEGEKRPGKAPRGGSKGKGAKRKKK